MCDKTPQVMQKLMATRAPRMPEQVSSTGNNGDLIEAVNVLQNKLANSGYILDISLPQIVVVGCQSAGKSSVLENIVGKEFLPRGSGVVTRRPTIVQLQKSKEEYAEFLHKPGEIFRNFEEVRAEIEKETLRDPGPNGFSSVPISLRIFSPNVLKLTLVDLPGLIRVTVHKQSEDSIKQVRKMVLKFISEPKSLILAVSPANQDIANSDALEIAKTVDPERVRTIGVLTKLDLMDEGTNARSVLENEIIPLKRGYIGVLNRSQRDIDEGKDFDYCLQKEKNFFESMPCYKHMAYKMGTPYLKKFLNKQLYVHIKEYLPILRKELAQKLAAFQKRINDFYFQIGGKSNENCSIQFYMIKLMQKFIDKLIAEVFGCTEKVKMDKLSAGSLINYKLFTTVREHLKLPKLPNKAQLMVTIANLHGIRNGISLPSLVLESTVNNVLCQYVTPLNNLIDSVAETLLSSIEECSEMMDSYPSLKNLVLYFVRKNIDEATFNTKDTLEKHMKAERYFVNTYHPDFAFPTVLSGRIFPMMWHESSDSTNLSVENSDLECEIVEANEIPASKKSMKVNSKSECVKSVNSDQSNIDASNTSIEKSDLRCEASEAIEILASNKGMKINVQFLAKTIKNYLIIQQKLLGDTAIKYVSFFLVKATMDFAKGELIPTILESAGSESIKEDLQKDFEKIKELNQICEFLEDALHAIHSF